MYLTAGCLLLAVTILVSGTLAWLKKTQEAKGTYTALSDFEVEGVLSFADGTSYSGTTMLVPVSFVADAENKTNYIGNMKYVVRYSGTSSALIRVRVLEQWTGINSNEVLPVSFLGYALVNGAGGAVTVGSAAEAKESIPAAGSGSSTDALAEPGQWVDNRAADYCYYYSVPVQPKTLVSAGTTPDLVVGEGSIELTLFNQRGADVDNAALIAGIDPATTKLDLLIEVEAVQPNRYREFWGLTALPQAPTS